MVKRRSLLHGVSTSTSSLGLFRIELPAIRLIREWFDFATVGKLCSFQYTKINFDALYSDIIFASYSLSWQLPPHRRIFRGTVYIECPSF